MNGSIKNDRSKWELLILWIAFICGMLFCSGYTSPLYPSYFGEDSALFSLVGKGIASGKVVYKDLFDHKGPILFFIEALGYSFGQRTGIFILQCLFGMINLTFLYGIWRKIRVKNNSLIDLLIVFIAGYSMFFYTFEKGNLSEEYSLPFISICLYLFVKYAMASNEKPKHPYKYSFVYGAAFMSIALIRINNAVTIVAGVLVIVLYLVYRKEYKNLLFNALYGLLGLCAIALPIVIYFAAHGVLKDMVYATYLYNFKYAGNTAHQPILGDLPKHIALYCPMICSVVLVAIRLCKEKRFRLFDGIILSIVLFNLISLLIFNSYSHYFTIFVPVFILVLAGYFRWGWKNLGTVMVVLCVALNMYLLARNFTTTIHENYILKTPAKAHSEILKITEQIPEGERTSVIGYEIPSAYYLYADIVPCYKYYTHQEWWAKSNPEIKTSFMEMLESGQALWLLTRPNESDATLLEAIAENYNLVDESKYFDLYRIKE